MSFYFEEITDPVERRKKLVQRGRSLCLEAKQAFTDGLLADAAAIKILNHLNFVSRTLEEIGKTDQ